MKIRHETGGKLRKLIFAESAPRHTVRPLVGIFDSGVGGLSVVRQFRRRRPDAALCYVADQAHAPYGPRSGSELYRFAEGITQFLLEQGAQIVTIACNTASAAALYELRRKFPDTVFVGMEPAVKPASERTHTGKIGVIATKGTFDGEPYAGVLQRYAADAKVYTLACPELVALVESGDIASERTRSVVSSTLEPLVETGIDELALACSHYSFLKPVIEEVCGEGVEVIDPADAVAAQLQRVCEGNPAPAADSRGTKGAACCFCTTGRPEVFRSSVAELLGIDEAVAPLRWETQ